MSPGLGSRARLVPGRSGGRPTCALRSGNTSRRSSGTTAWFPAPAHPGTQQQVVHGAAVRPHRRLGLRARKRASPTRVCNAVCNGLGHNVTQPGTTWHNREVPRTPQAPPCGTRRHILAQRGTTWHNPTPCLRVLQGLPHKPTSSASKPHFGRDRWFARGRVCRPTLLGSWARAGLRPLTGPAPQRGSEPPRRAQRFTQT